MSDDRPRMAGYDEPNMNVNTPMMQAPQAGQISQMSMGGMVLMQQVRQERNEDKIRQKVVAMAIRNADSYMYSWEVRNSRTGKTETIEGGTIKMANDLARLWGNCRVIPNVTVNADHFLIDCYFIDLETNFMMSRPFKQNRNINIGGKYDDGRKDDMALQIGVSKCYRNTVLNALSEMHDLAVATVKKQVVKWVEANPEKVAEYLSSRMERYNIPKERIEKTIGRRTEAWTVQDKSIAMMKFRTLDEGAASAEDVFPESVLVSSAVQRGETDTVAGAGAGQNTGKPPEQQQEGSGQKMVEHVDPETGEVTQVAAEAPPTHEGKAAKAAGGRKKAAAEAKEGGQAAAAATAADKEPANTSRSPEPEGGAPAQEQLPKTGETPQAVQQNAQPAKAASNDAPPRVNLFEDGAV